VAIYRLSRFPRSSRSEGYASFEVPDHFPRGSPVRRVNNEPAVTLLAGRALVLQLAHPLVAQGVEDHSDFRRNPFKRLQGTLGAMYWIVNGSADQAAAVGRRIHRIHEHVVGASYRANDPANLLWVHATLVDSALLGYRTFVGTLGDEDTERYYEAMKLVAVPLGLPAAYQPPTYRDFRAFFDETVDSLQVGRTSRDLIDFVLYPTLPVGLHVPLAPALALERLITVGATPATLRDRIGFSWDAARQVAFDALATAVRTASALQPSSLRTVPASWVLASLARAGHGYAHRDEMSGIAV
jgi:uncharacterized protein (DUF2236 family)